ncbi:non-classical arabinogalactan protein 31-like [Aristolochia californica]|uniref:non-classical arabinogalactan protein 31-like n=1 Tax=Aristolochia californica TaxID=171875 RepID=UPI0035D962E0
MAGFALCSLKNFVSVWILVFAIIGPGVESLGAEVQKLAPSKAPFPTRSLVAVEGVIYCKSCKFPGIDTLFGATPLAGAVAKLECNSTKHPVTSVGKTDKNGYFLINAAKVSSYGVHKCRVFLASSPSAFCKEPTNINGGIKGARLIFRKVFFRGTKPVFLYTSGPLAFAPSNKTACVH